MFVSGFHHFPLVQFVPLALRSDVNVKVLPCCKTSQITTEHSQLGSLITVSVRRCDEFLVSFCVFDETRKNEKKQNNPPPHQQQHLQNNNKQTKNKQQQQKYQIRDTVTTRTKTRRRRRRPATSPIIISSQNIPRAISVLTLGNKVIL